MIVEWYAIKCFSLGLFFGVVLHKIWVKLKKILDFRVF